MPRLMKEASELSKPTELYYAQPVEDNLFEWHFTIRGPEDSEFSGGLYHGRIILPSEYPMKPPNVIFLTENGRFDINRKICLSISDYHPESWRPSWSIRTALLAVIGFMPTPGAGSIGSLDFPKEERKVLARKSTTFHCVNCGMIKDLVLPLTDASKKDIEEAKEAASQMTFTSKGDIPKESSVMDKDEEKREPQCSDSTPVATTVKPPMVPGVTPVDFTAYNNAYNFQYAPFYICFPMYQFPMSNAPEINHISNFQSLTSELKKPMSFEEFKKKRLEEKENSRTIKETAVGFCEPSTKLHTEKVDVRFRQEEDKPSTSTAAVVSIQPSTSAAPFASIQPTTSKIAGSNVPLENESTAAPSTSSTQNFADVIEKQESKPSGAEDLVEESPSDETLLRRRKLEAARNVLEAVKAHHRERVQRMNSENSSTETPTRTQTKIRRLLYLSIIILILIVVKRFLLAQLKQN